MISTVFGYYGKLPISPEFLRLHAAGPEVRWLDDWLQRGVLYAKTTEGPRWSALVAESDLWNFMYVPAGQGRIVCGVLFASQDKAGRSFPFLTFFLLNRGSLAGNIWLGPIVGAEFLDAIATSLQQLRANLEWESFCSAVAQFDDKNISVDSTAEAFAQIIRSKSVKEWCLSLWGTFDDPRKYRLEEGLRAVLRKSKQFVKGHLPWGVKLPLFAGTTVEQYDLPFWLATSVRCFSQVQQSEPGMLVFWNRNPRKVSPCALVSMGPGSPKVTRIIISPEARDESWIDVLSDEQSPSQPAASRACDYAPVMDNPDLPLDRLLDYLAESA
jgi:type VI secretion system ImpM family protein